MTVAQWLRKAQKFLDERGVPESGASSEFLLAEVLACGRAELGLRADSDVAQKKSHQFWEMIKARGLRRPLGYITGHQPFLGLDLEVTTDCLIPRPETEELVMECVAILERMKSGPLHVLEIGTGTGCIAIALAKLTPRATIYATDVGAKVLNLAEKNAAAHHVIPRIRFVREDLFSSAPRSGWADLLVSNPPYIRTGDLDALEPEVLCEPRMALDGGRDGLDYIRALAKMAPSALKNDGAIALEIGAAQADAVREIFAAEHLRDIVIKKDAAGRDRIAVGKMVK